MGKTVLATTEIVCTIIGAGFLAIPYVMMQAGYLLGLAHLLILAVLMAVTMLYFGEIVIRTKENHQLPGYAGKYLGKIGKKAMFFAVAFGIYTALLAYLLAEGESVSYFLFGSSAYALPISVLFWMVFSAIVYFGIQALEKAEVISIVFVGVIITAMIIFFSNKISPGNLMEINLGNALFPFGVILFAYLGFTAIPEVKLILQNDLRKMKRSIIYAYIISFVVYVLFTLVVVGSQGKDTPEIATLILGRPFILLGVLTMFTAYISLSNSMMDTLRFDYKKNKAPAFAYTVIVPMVLLLGLHLMGKSHFVTILGIGGVISGGLTAILILLMVRSAKLNGDRHPEYTMKDSAILKGILIFMFCLGAIIEIMHALSG